MEPEELAELCDRARRRLSLRQALYLYGAGLTPQELMSTLLDVWAELQVGDAAQAAAAFGAALGMIRVEEPQGPGIETGVADPVPLPQGEESLDRLPDSLYCCARQLR